MWAAARRKKAARKLRRRSRVRIWFLLRLAWAAEPARAVSYTHLTKGKTTTTYLMKAILEKAGFKTGLIGTTGNLIGDRSLPSNMTTPDPVDLHRCLRQMVDEGVEAVSMEVSAHAVDMHRVDGITFEAA